MSARKAEQRAEEAPPVGSDARGRWLTGGRGGMGDTRACPMATGDGLRRFLVTEGAVVAVSIVAASRDAILFSTEVPTLVVAKFCTVAGAIRRIV